MILRAVFLADGSSDLALADHLTDLCAARGLDVRISTPDPRRLQAGSRLVSDRLIALAATGDPFDLVFVHRDAEAQSPALRREEISQGALAAGVTKPVVPVVPVRMTEAWLLLDEGMIRSVAGRPNGLQPLDLPTLRRVESVADPKAILQQALTVASGTTGRRHREFQRDFGRHRATLLKRLDPNGPVSQLASWKALVADIDALATTVAQM